MPARDTHHDAVREALRKDGWTITHDPLRVLWQGKALFMDLGAERILTAERGQEKIAVEVKTFIDPDAVHEIHSAAGQYVFYRAVLRRLHPERILHLAIPHEAFDALFATGRVGEVLAADEQIRLLVFDVEKREIRQWIEP